LHVLRRSEPQFDLAYESADPLARSASPLIAFAEAAEQPPEKQRHDGGGGIGKFNPI